MPIAITGLGVASPLGLGAEAFWAGLQDGTSGIGPMTELDGDALGCPLAAQAPALDLKAHLPKAYRKFVRVMARDIQLAVVAAELAVADALARTGRAEPGIAEQSIAEQSRAGSASDGGEGPASAVGLGHEPWRLGTHVGAGLIAPEIPELARAMHASAGPDGRWDMRLWGQRGMDQLTPLWMLKYLPNMLACHVSILHQAKGPSNTITAGEASGLLCVGEAMRVIERGDADASLAGSGDSRTNLLAIERLRLAGRLADPGIQLQGLAGVARPFDPDAAGSVPGEAAALCVLEKPDAARSLGRRALAHLLGFGAAHAAPPADAPLGASMPIPAAAAPAGRGQGSRAPADQALAEALARAIRSALVDAQVPAESVDAVFCQGLGVPALDAAEARGLRLALGDRLESVELFAVTPVAGVTMAASGSLLVAAAALALHHQRLPARLQHGRPLPGLRAEAAASRPADLERVLVCSIGLGGPCAALVLGR